MVGLVAGLSLDGLPSKYSPSPTLLSLADQDQLHMTTPGLKEAIVIHLSKIMHRDWSISRHVTFVIKTWPTVTKYAPVSHSGMTDA